MTAEKRAAEVARSVREGEASDLVKYLFNTLPKAAHGKIADIEAWLEERDDYWPSTSSVNVHPLDKRAAAETLQAYGLELDLDAAGLAVRIRTPYEFTA